METLKLSGQKKTVQIKKKLSITIDDVMDAIESDDCQGFCIDCGEMAYNVEPDARNYECESCGKRMVFGSEEILIGGLI